MTITEAKKHLQEAEGFTLVELAVVMIIIGLLIGGVLQGQQLIENARVTNVVSTIKAYEVAQTTFLDSYNGLPGDLPQPDARLPNCSGTCANAGDGDGTIESNAAGNVLAYPALAPAQEQETYFVHLSAAGMVDGVDTTSSTTNQFGEVFPENPLGGGFHVGFYDGALADFDATNFAGAVIGTPPIAPARGTYLVMTDVADAAVAASLTPGLAARMDIKLDDGEPGTGNVRSLAGAGANTCTDVEDDQGAAVYNSANDSLLCALMIRVQG